MGMTIFMVLLVCGYWYATRDGKSRLRLKRTSGWEVYFLVALYGSVFIFQGFNLVMFIWLSLFIISSILNNFSSISEVDGHLNLHSDFMNLTLFHFQAPLLIMLFLSLLLCLFHTTVSPKKNLSNTTRVHLYKEFTKADGVGNILYNSMEMNELISITLISGRRYIGLIYAAINESTSHGSLILLPFLQGRDGPGILGFTVERNYCHLYKRMEMDKGGKQSNNILKLRLVIMSHQVESVEYFTLNEY